MTNPYFYYLMELMLEPTSKRDIDKARAEVGGTGKVIGVLALIFIACFVLAAVLLTPWLLIGLGISFVALYVVERLLD